MAAATIVQAVLERFAGSGEVAVEFTESGGLWLDMTPPQQTLPFITMLHGGEQYEWCMEREYREIGSIDFYLFAKHATRPIAETERLALMVRDLFDKCIKRPGLLTIQSATMISWERTGYKIETAPFMDQSQQQVGQATFSYAYKVQRTLPES